MFSSWTSVESDLLPRFAAVADCGSSVIVMASPSVFGADLSQTQVMGLLPARHLGEDDFFAGAQSGEHFDGIGRSPAELHVPARRGTSAGIQHEQRNRGLGRAVG